MKITLFRLLQGLLGAMIYGVGVVTLLTTNPNEQLRGAIALSLISLQILRIFFKGRSNSLFIVLSLTAILLYALPSLGVVLLLGVDVLPTVLMFILFFDVIIAVAQRDARQRLTPLRKELGRSKTKKRKLLLAGLLLWCAIAGLLFDTTGFLGLFVFVVPFSLSLVLFERLLTSWPSTRAVFGWAIAFLATLSIYIAFYWHGGGRLIIGSFILAPLLIINHYRDVGLRVGVLAVGAPFALYAAQISRYGSLSGVDQFLIGSAGHHLMVTHDIVSENTYSDFGGVEVFFSQYILMFFNWVPRSLWPEKPLGVGSWSVDALYGQAGMPEYHSISVGFLGELYLYLGVDFWIGALITISTLLLFRRIVARINFGYVAPLVIFDVSLMSYFWGGMAIFGSRIWFLLLPALLLIWWFSRRGSSVSHLTHHPHRRMGVSMSGHETR